MIPAFPAKIFTTAGTYFFKDKKYKISAGRKGFKGSKRDIPA